MDTGALVVELRPSEEWSKVVLCLQMMYAIGAGHCHDYQEGERIVLEEALATLDRLAVVKFQAQ